MKLSGMKTSSSPCAPFTVCPSHRMPRMQSRRLVVKSQARNNETDDALFVRQMGKICAPFAAAVLLFAQSPGPAHANPVTDTFENTLKRQQDLGSSKLDFNAFFNKGKKTAEETGQGVKDAAEATKDASDPSKAATQVPQKIPTFGKPVDSSASAEKVAEDAKNKLNPFKFGGGDNKAPGEQQFRQTAKEGTKDNFGAGSNSNAQPSAAPAYADKDEEKALQKAEKFQQKAESGNPDKPRLDPSIVEGEPEPGPAPGTPNKLPEQPKPEPGSFTQLGKDSSGGKVQETKRGSSPLDLFGGGPSGETPTSKAETLIEKSEEPQNGSILDFIQKGLTSSSLPQSSANDVGSLAELEPPQPSQAIEKLPESSPGDQNDLPDQPEPEPTPPSALGKDTPGGKTDSTKSGGGILDFFGGSSKNTSEAPQNKSGLYLASNSQQGEFSFLLAAEPPPQPTELDEPEPKAAPGEENTLPDQPRPESASYQTPQDSSGGKTEDTKRGGGPLDFFGGPDSGNTGKSAEKNVQKATSAKIGNGSSSEVALIAEEESTEDGRVVIAGVLFSIALEIAIFSSYPAPEAHGKH